MEFDVPGSGVVAIWAWAFERDVQALETTERLVRTIDFRLPS